MNCYTVVLAMVAAFCQPALGADSVQESINWLLSLKLANMPRDDEPLVCVVVSGSHAQGERMRLDYALGFLETDDGTEYQVRFLGAGREKGDRAKWQQDTPPQNVVRKLSAAEAVEWWCGEKEASAKAYPDPIADTLVLAAVLYKRGEDEAVQTLIRRMKVIFPKAWPEAPDLIEVAKEQLASGLLNEVIRDFGDVAVPRKQLEAQLSQIVEHFSGTEPFKTAELMLGPLRNVIGEENLVANLPFDDDALAKLPVRERIAALILRLSEQTGRQTEMPGMCDLFYDDPALARFRQLTIVNGILTEPTAVITPAGKLFQIGLEAVPQLIEAIEDHRPTRAVGTYRPISQRSPVLDVGDCALQILCRLSGRSFEPQDSFRGNSDEMRADIKRNAEAWWEEVKSGHEAEILEKKISAGDRYASIARLKQIAPDRVVPALERFLASGSGDTDIYLGGLAGIDTEPARALMRRMVTQGRSLWVRLNAAQWVYQGAYSETDRQMALDAIVAEWKKSPINAARSGASAERMAGLAAATPSLLPTICNEVPRLSPMSRAEFIEGLAASLSVTDRIPQARQDAVLEDFLANELEDVAFAFDASFRKNDQILRRGARVAEFAADLLHQLWPERYSFTWDASADDIEQSRFAGLNAWRKARNLPPVTRPPPPLSARDDPATVTKISFSKDSAPLKPSLKKQVDAWLGKPLSGEALTRFFADFAILNADDTRSIRIATIRGVPRSGFEIELHTGTRPILDANADYHVQVDVDGTNVIGSSDGLELRLASDRKLGAYDKFEEAIAQALAAPQAPPVFIQIWRLGSRQKAP